MTLKDQPATTSRAMPDMFYPSRIADRPIYVIWHTWTPPSSVRHERYRSITARQLHALRSSRLIDLAETIYISAPRSAAQVLRDQLADADSAHFSLYDEDQHEGYTLKRLKELVDTGTIPAGAFILYFHTRGTSRTEENHTQQCADDWTRMLEYFCIQRWRFAIESLQSHYTCGCEMWPHTDHSNQRTAFASPREFWHYSGNFWWAQSDYVREFLAEPQLYFSGEFLTDRARSEDWILSSVGQLTLPGEHKVLHYTGNKYQQGAINSYADRYPPNFYLGGSETPLLMIRGQERRSQHHAGDHKASN